jgi:hypothetical protein
VLQSQASLSYWGGLESGDAAPRSIRRWLPFACPSRVVFERRDGTLGASSGEALGKLRRVKQVVLVDHRVSAEFFKACGMMNSVELLHVIDCEGFNDAILSRCIMAFPNAKYVELNSVDVTGTAFDSGMHIETIRVTGCPVSEGAINTIATLPYLKELTLSELTIRDEVLDWFTAERPDVELFRPSEPLEADRW